jgi:hypothetical protein
VDKIDQFAAEFGNPATSPSEQLLALKFGGLHQADDHDAGGNKSSSRLEDCTPASFIATGMSSSWSGWELTRVKLRQA